MNRPSDYASAFPEVLTLLKNAAIEHKNSKNAPPNFHIQMPENLVFKGGGAKFIAHIGVLQVLEQRGMLSHVKRVGGTSAGAIVSTLVAVGYRAQEIETLLKAMKLNDLWMLVLVPEEYVKERHSDIKSQKRSEIKQAMPNFTFGELKRGREQGLP